MCISETVIPLGRNQVETPFRESATSTKRINERGEEKKRSLCAETKVPGRIALKCLFMGLASEQNKEVNGKAMN